MKSVFFLSGEYIVRKNVDDIEKKSRGRSGDSVLSSQFSEIKCFGVGEEQGSTLIALSDDGKIYKKEIALISFYTYSSSEVVKVKELFGIDSEVPNFVQFSIVKNDVFNSETSSFVFATQKGLVKKTLTKEFSGTRSGIVAIGLNDGDKVVGFTCSDESKDVDIFLFSSLGNLCRINSSEFRPISRASMGSYGMAIREGSKVISISSNLNSEDLVLTVCSKGKGKLSNVSEFSAIGKGKKVGVRSHKITDNTGSLVGACLVKSGEEVLVFTTENKIIRLGVSEINLFGRSCEGVKLINLGDRSSVISALKV